MEALNIQEILDAVKGTLICGNENLCITSVSTNSTNITPGALFVPILGERIDAHDYIGDAFAHGAIACFTSRDEITDYSKVYIRVSDTKEALQSLAAYYRSKFQIPLVGITGSVGKTSTKEMVAAALSTKYKVLKTEGNMNSQVGLPLMMFQLERAHEIAVIEMGISEEHEMDRLTKIAKPEVAIITNIGVSHIGQLKSKENIRKEKLKIVNEFKRNSTIFLNGNDDLLKQLANLSSTSNGEATATLELACSATTKEKLSTCNRIFYGFNDFCNYRGENIRIIDGKTYVSVVYHNDMEFTNALECSKDLKDNSDFSDQKESCIEELELNLIGTHHVQNALVALAVAKYYDIPLSVAKNGIKNYVPIAMRGQILERNGYSIIDDSYNASPDSMKSGIDVLLQLSELTRRVVVLADIKELGAISEQSHYEIGEYISKCNIDEVITVGMDSKYIHNALMDQAANCISHHFTNNVDAISYLKANLKEGDGILVKGSRSMHMDEVVKAL